MRWQEITLRLALIGGLYLAIWALNQKDGTAPLPVRASWGVKFLAAEPGTELVRVQIDCVASVG